jgi:hypothetical protein
MTSEDIRSELERIPFSPFRLHLVSGKTFDVQNVNNVAMLQNAIVVYQPPPQNGYDVIALRNIERIEQSLLDG